MGCPGDTVLLNEDPNRLQMFLDRLDYSVARFDMLFEGSKCKMFLEDRIGSRPNAVLARAKLSEADKCSCLDSCVSLHGRIPEEVPSCTQKVRLAFTKLRHLWSQHGFKLPTQYRTFAANVRSVLLYSPEAWSLKAGDMRKLVVVEICCPINNAV